MDDEGPILSRDPMAGTECHRPDDRFIPVRSCELATNLADDATRFGATPGALLSVFHAVEQVIDQEVAAFERILADHYAAFNPDRDTLPQADVAQSRTPQDYHDLHAQLDYLLTKANLVPLSDEEIQRAIDTANSFGLRVRLHPGRLAHMRVWVRGLTRTQRVARSWRHPVRGQTPHLRSTPNRRRRRRP